MGMLCALYFLQVITFYTVSPLSYVVVFMVKIAIGPIAVVVMRTDRMAKDFLIVTHCTLMGCPNRMAMFIVFVQFFLEGGLVQCINRRRVLIL